MAQLFDFVIDGAVLFDVGVGVGDIGFRLVIVVVGHKIFHRIVREKCLKLRA